jgi:putative phosphoesterase
MDTILFASDLHGNAAASEALLEKSSRFGAEALLLAGDTCPSGGSLLAHSIKTAGTKVLMVRGNCDSQYAFDQSGLPFPPSIRRIAYGNRTIILFHGDVRFSDEILRAGGQDILVSGHTHRPMVATDLSGNILANPGSPTYPRGREGATYGFIGNGRIEIRYFSSDKPVPGLQYSLMPRSQT